MIPGCSESSSSSGALGTPGARALVDGFGRVGMDTLPSVALTSLDFKASVPPSPEGLSPSTFSASGGVLTTRPAASSPPTVVMSRGLFQTRFSFGATATSSVWTPRFDTQQHRRQSFRSFLCMFSLKKGRIPSPQPMIEKVDSPHSSEPGQKLAAARVDFICLTPCETIP